MKGGRLGSRRGRRRRLPDLAVGAPLKGPGRDEADKHLAALDAGERPTVVAALEEQLLQQPAVETRNRKPLRPNPVAPWVFRVERFPVYFEVRTKPDAVVTVRAIGIKERNRVTIGGVEVDLSCGG